MIKEIMRICSISDCLKKHDSHGYCINHARQYRKYGHILTLEEISRHHSEARLKGKGALGAKWSQKARLAQSERLKGRTLNTGKTHFKKGYKPWNKDIIYEAIKGERNYAWKGDDVGYFTLHKWVIRELGQPTSCEKCLKANLSGQQIHWSNISGEYQRVLSDWQRLCAKFHRQYDINNGLIGIRG